MKGFSMLCFLLVFLEITSVCHANVADDTIRYNRLQIDSIVAVEVQRQVEVVVKAEMTRQMNNELIDLKIDKAANDKLGVYITEQNNHLTLHDFFVGAIITILVTIAGIVVPLILNRNKEKTLKELIKDAKEAGEAAEKSALYAKFSERLARALANEDNGVQLSVLAEIINDYKDKDFVSAAYTSRGICYAKSGNRKKAISDYKKAIKIDPKFYPAFNSLGTSYNKLGEYDEAIKNFEKAIELNPDYQLAYINRGLSYTEQHDFKKAIDDYNEAINLNPNVYKAYYYRGNTHCETNEYVEALADFNAAINLNPSYARGYYARCEVYQRINQLEKALEDAEKGLQFAKNQGKTDLIESFEKKIKEIQEELGR